MTCCFIPTPGPMHLFFPSFQVTQGLVHQVGNVLKNRSEFTLVKENLHPCKITDIDCILVLAFTSGAGGQKSCLWLMVKEWF